MQDRSPSPADAAMAPDEVSRRRLLQLTAYVAPAIVGMVMLEPAPAMAAATCVPQACNPTKPCMPGGTCMPDFCGPDGYCGPSFCMPNP